MFERFAEAARAVVVNAQELAMELDSGYIGPEHLLYGCAEVRDDTAGAPLREAGVTVVGIRRLMWRPEQPPTGEVDADELRAIGIDYEEVRSAVEQTFGSGALESAPDRRNPSRRIRRPPFTPEAKRALELSLRVTVELHHHRMTPGHLLLGLLRLDDDFVSKVLEQADTTVAELSSTVLRRIAAAAA